MSTLNEHFTQDEMDLLVVGLLDLEVDLDNKATEARRDGYARLAEHQEGRLEAVRALLYRLRGHH